MRIKSRPNPRYHQDFYAWSRAQADLLRNGRLSELDLEHLTDEVEELSDALKRSVRNRIRTIVEHLLKLECSPARDPRPGWRASVRTQRIRLRDALTDSLRREIEDDLAELYVDARALAEGAPRDHGEDTAADALSKTCPYPLDRAPRCRSWRPQENSCDD